MACDEEPVNERLLAQEPITVSGDWVLTNIYQNEVEVTNDLGLNSFVLTLNYNGEQPTTYSITMDKRYPFFMSDLSGEWALDNGVFPNAIHFFQNDTITTRLNQPLYPENNTMLSLVFNLGCVNNEYVYEFRKEPMP